MLRGSGLRAQGSRDVSNMDPLSPLSIWTVINGVHLGRASALVVCAVIFEETLNIILPKLLFHEMIKYKAGIAYLVLAVIGVVAIVHRLWLLVNSMMM